MIDKFWDLIELEINLINPIKGLIREISKFGVLIGVQIAKLKI
jgi:hypothetical protein